jgi:hypothetical protein
MKNIDERIWASLTGGYRTALDPRQLVSKLNGENDESSWQELWEELHHQGDVGDASYAAVPLIVEACRNKEVIDWNLYALVAIIELARTENRNPDLPVWLVDDYSQAIQELASKGAAEVLSAKDPDTIRAILSVIALAKGLRTHAAFLVNYTDDEMLEMQPNC